MFKFIGKALAGLFLTKEARQVVGQRIVQGKGAKKPPKGSAAGDTARDETIAQAQAQVKGLVTPERAELIRQAMQVRAAKQSILADLNDEDRAKLVAAAMKALLNEGRAKE